MEERKRLSDILPQSDRENLARLWDTTRPADDLGLLPAGEYSCRLLDGAAFTAKSGTRGYKITFEIVDGDHAGRRIWSEPMWLTEAALAISKRELARIGVTRLDQLDHPLPRGILATVKVVVHKDDDGSEHNRVKWFRPTGIEPPEPFAPSGDGGPAEPDNGSTPDQAGFDWATGQQEDPPEPGRGRGAYSRP
jgi:hypothetical protein